MRLIFDTIYETVKQIPAGEVASYGQIARLIDAPRSARVVGWAMQKAPKGVPAHRVVKKDGSVNEGILFQGSFTQRELLEREGVRFYKDGRVVMVSHSWK
ncbi:MULTISPECIES: MGMT family protein [Shouchella]|uniref:Alkyltransferase-like protein 1 n=3 Tax=Bacillaceae TaxID=186817 RepID=A0A060LSC9_9BACI|nr:MULTISPECIES: MGMT family protein [Bacillaceae]AIC94156.1 alkyltransferase-like protein 1 [Shouchella lehensis G1]KQL57924.1 cysteine methyltransferase [Alkalicoccobacillus plakortidis]MBG9785779.1 cysteine methyltransferase [Shouchella lehensis]TES48247.1 MGMT family protein [Shouchella lehensis]